MFQGRKKKDAHVAVRAREDGLPVPGWRSLAGPTIPSPLSPKIPSTARRMR